MQRLDLELRAGTPALRRRSRETLERVRDTFGFLAHRAQPRRPGWMRSGELAARVARY